VAGKATIEAYTVMHNRDGEPDTAIAAVLLKDSRRAWSTSTDRQVSSALCVGEWVGRKVNLNSDGNLNV
jgi:acetyl-CoA C-acetyltransferase